MRIIAGKLRRRKLLTNPGFTTRPFTDRAKTIVFDLLQWQIKGKKVADIFSGTGTMGFECLSRGAAKVVFIEADHRAYELLVKNAEALAATENTLCWRVDVFRSSFRPKGTEAWCPYDLVFFDPPYKMIRDLRPGTPLYKAMIRLSRSDVMAEDGLMVLRTPEHDEFVLPPVWQVAQRLEISSMVVHFLKKSPAASQMAGLEPLDEDLDPEDCPAENAGGDGVPSSESAAQILAGEAVGNPAVGE